MKYVIICITGILLFFHLQASQSKTVIQLLPLAVVQQSEEKMTTILEKKTVADIINELLNKALNSKYKLITEEKMSEKGEIMIAGKLDLDEESAYKIIIQISLLQTESRSEVRFSIRDVSEITQEILLDKIVPEIDTLLSEHVTDLEKRIAGSPQQLIPSTVVKESQRVQEQKLGLGKIPSKNGTQDFIRPYLLHSVILSGVSLTALGGGVAFLLFRDKAIDNQQYYTEKKPDENWLKNADKESERAELYNTLGVTSLILAGVGAIGATTLFLITKSRKSEVGVSFDVSDKRVIATLQFSF